MSNIHHEIETKINDGSISNSSKEELEKYFAALCKPHAHGSYGGGNHQYQAILTAIQTLLKLKISEENNSERHQEIKGKLEELKKPHWTVSPNFWLTFIAAISGVVGCILTWHSAQQPKNSPIGAVQQSAMSTAKQPEKKKPPQQIEHTQLSPKPESSPHQ